MYHTIARASHRSLFVQPAPDLQGVNGQVVTVIGETEIRIDHVRQPVKVRIVDDLNQNMILGCDVLAGAQIDMSRRILAMHGHSWSLFSNDIGIAGLEFYLSLAARRLMSYSDEMPMCFLLTKTQSEIVIFSHAHPNCRASDFFASLSHAVT